MDIYIYTHIHTFIEHRWHSSLFPEKKTGPIVTLSGALSPLIALLLMNNEKNIYKLEKTIERRNEQGVS